MSTVIGKIRRGTKKEIKEQEENKRKDILKMNKAELLKVAEEKGIEVTENATKEVIINLIKEQEENKE